MSHILLSSENQTAGKLRQVLVNFRKDEQQRELTWSEGFVHHYSVYKCCCCRELWDRIISFHKGRSGVSYATEDAEGSIEPPLSI